MKNILVLVLACLIIAISAQNVDVQDGDNGKQSTFVQKFFSFYLDENGSLNYLTIGVTLFLLLGVFFVVCKSV